MNRGPTVSEKPGRKRVHGKSRGRWAAPRTYAGVWGAQHKIASLIDPARKFEGCRVHGEDGVPIENGKRAKEDKAVEEKHSFFIRGFG